MSNRLQTAPRGFTLVEMSIVLVIIGLILGGVMAGQSLVRASRLNSVVTDMHKFEAYLGTFRLKYDALPGDIKNAYDYWGVALGCTNELMTLGGTGCNGNGNGDIPYNTEGYRAWQHLTASEIMPGSYTGTSTNGSTAFIGINVPASRIDGGGYAFQGGSVYQRIGNFLAFGAEAATTSVNTSIVTSSEAQGIDKKMDDGLADHGKVVSLDGLGAADRDCVTWGLVYNTLPSPYTLTTTNVSCRMYFQID